MTTNICVFLRATLIKYSVRFRKEIFTNQTPHMSAKGHLLGVNKLYSQNRV